MRVRDTIKQTLLAYTYNKKKLKVDEHSISTTQIAITEKVDVLREI